MRNKVILGSILTGLLSAGYALTFAVPTADAGDPKNLKIYPKGTDSKAIKKDMKAIAKALGVTCEHCHDTSDFSKDSEAKTKARSMMKMTQTINKSLKKDGFDGKVSCMTCHMGAAEPKN